jgi:hypothetical protein
VSCNLAHRIDLSHYLAAIYIYLVCLILICFGSFLSVRDERNEEHFLSLLSDWKMKAKNTFRVHYVLRPNKNHYGKSSIYARIVVNGNRTEISIKAFVLPGDWNSSRGATSIRGFLFFSF